VGFGSRKREGPADSNEVVKRCSEAIREMDPTLREDEVQKLEEE